MRREILVSALVGCAQVYDLDPTNTETLEPAQCATIRFNAPQPLGDYISGQEYDPQLSRDGLELWFTTTAENQPTIYRGTRPDLASEFTVSTVTFPPITRGFDPSLTADGRRLMFIDMSEHTVYEAVRSDPTTGTFESVRSVVGLLAFPTGIESLDLSWDGLRLYYTGGDGRLFFAKRPSRDEPFGYAQELVDDGTAFNFPSVSPDELEIFYNHRAPGARTVYRRVREKLDAPFGPEEIVLDDGADPDVAPGSDKLIIGANNALYILERACPGKQ